MHNECLLVNASNEFKMNDISLKIDCETSVVASEFDHGIASVFTVGTEKKEFLKLIEHPLTFFRNEMEMHIFSIEPAI